MIYGEWQKRKNEEINRSDSRLNQAHDNELIFVIIGRDAAAAEAIFQWCRIRVKLNRNTWEDSQIQEALSLAKQMEIEGGTFK